MRRWFGHRQLYVSPIAKIVIRFFSVGCMVSRWCHCVLVQLCLGQLRSRLSRNLVADGLLARNCRRMFVGGTLVLFLTTLIPAVAGNGSLHALQRQHIDTLWSKLTNVTSELVRCRAEVRASRNEAEEAGGAIQGAQESAENAKSGVKTMFQALQAQKKHAKVLSDHVIAEQQSSAKLRRQLRALQATNSSQLALAPTRNILSRVLSNRQ